MGDESDDGDDDDEQVKEFDGVVEVVAVVAELVATGDARVYVDEFVANTVLV